MKHQPIPIVPPVYRIYKGTESATYLGTKIREMIPFGIKNFDCFTGFKQTRLRNLIIVYVDHVNI